jgi:hypothetical protein
LHRAAGGRGDIDRTAARLLASVVTELFVMASRLPALIVMFPALPARARGRNGSSIAELDARSSKNPNAATGAALRSRSAAGFAMALNRTPSASRR